MTPSGRRTSFFALTGDDQAPDSEGVARIEIPLFQRDYAQGREGPAVERIRTDFLSVLRGALADGAAPVGLDFVYGGVEAGTLRPLDGQQRLTTLFLLHWYLASRSGHLAEDHGWKRFSYATRESARMFCESLAEHPLPAGVEPKAWITDQAWYLFVWHHDPTIESMLVMLDAIHHSFADVDAEVAWARLTDVADPAIWFLLLPLSDLEVGAGVSVGPEELYIKMNSRGKPLTEFERFKAHFEKTLAWSERADELSRKIDTDWSDLLWHLRGDDDLIDDEFLRYLTFITEICEWREGRADGSGRSLDRRTQDVFGVGDEQREEHLKLLFQAFNIWVAHPPTTTFESLFTSQGETIGLDDAPDESPRVRLFQAESGSPDSVDLFADCCSTYGETAKGARPFSLGQRLLLYAVLLHLIEDTPSFPTRLRVLRNLIESSGNELRLDRMPNVIVDVHHVIWDGDVAAVSVLNQAQVADELAKATFLTAHPALRPVLHALEDHELLRGSLGAFELDPSSFQARASAFHRIMGRPDCWTELLGALLAVGEYQRSRTGTDRFLFGTSSQKHDSAWRELLTGPSRDALRATREVLGSFLDRIAAAPDRDLTELLPEITSEYLATCEAEARFDWRYYMVRYPAMREKGSSTFIAESTGAGEATMGYSLRMLKAGGRWLNGYHRDPYLLAIYRELDDVETVVKDPWFIGYEPCRLQLLRSGTEVRCTPTGFELTPPEDDDHGVVFDALQAEVGAGSDGLVVVPQVEVDGRVVDTTDRIQFGAQIVRRLIAAGL